MMISTKAKLAFLAMPRNASTSIESALLPYADIAFKGYPRFKHINLSIYNLRLRPFLNANGFEGTQTVALFREPVSWLESWFQYRSDPAIKLKQNSAAGVSFNEFVEAYLMDESPDFAKVGQQSKFVKGENTDCGVDYLFKFENLNVFQSFISERFSAKFEFISTNASKNRDTELSPALLSELKERFKTDFDIYESIAL